MLAPLSVTTVAITPEALRGLYWTMVSIGLGNPNTGREVLQESSRLCLGDLGSADQNRSRRVGGGSCNRDVCEEQDEFNLVSEMPMEDDCGQ